MSWADICPVAASGIDCLTDQAGTVDEILFEPLPLGNVFDYGADPTGNQQQQRFTTNGHAASQLELMFCDVFMCLLHLCVSLPV